MSENENRIATDQAKIERGLVTDVVTSVVSGAAGGVAGAVVTQGMAKLGGANGDKGGKKE